MITISAAEISGLVGHDSLKVLAIAQTMTTRDLVQAYNQVYAGNLSQDELYKALIAPDTASAIDVINGQGSAAFANELLTWVNFHSLVG